MKQIPNLFTLLNLVFGCLAIIFILQINQSILYVDGNGYSMIDLPERITWGCFFIFAAGLVDFLDGFVARLFKAHSAMGKQLDSLADAVSFGVAPGMVLYQLLRLGYAKEVNGLEISLAHLLPALLIPCAAVWRLAKFNLDDSQQYSFKGIPTPAIGLTIASFPLILFYQQTGASLLTNQWLLDGVILLFSFLMISPIPMLSLKFKDFSIKNNLPKYLLAVIGVVAILVLKWTAAPVLLIAYVLVSLLFKNKTA